MDDAAISMNRDDKVVDLHARPEQARARVDNPYTRVLSADEGSVFFIPSTSPLRKLVCLLGHRTEPRAVLKVSRAHQTDGEVTGYIQKLRLRRLAFTIESEMLEKLPTYYSAEVVVDEDIVDTPTKAKIIQIIRQGVREGASDVRFVIGADYCAIRFQIDGREKTWEQVSRDEGYSLARTLYGPMTDRAEPQLDETRMQDGQLRRDYAHLCDLAGSRIATKPAARRGLMMTLRLLYGEKGEVEQTIDHAGYLPEQLVMLRRMEKLKFGINLLSGVTGSGKSTSLVGVVSEIDRDNDHEAPIITIEDPVEYEMTGAGIIQTPLVVDPRLDPEVALKRAWPDALRNCLRHAPKVLVPGEIRDAESAQIAYNVALSGHVVWSTIHTFDIFSILNRLKQLGVDEDLLTNPSLTTGLINQSLVRTLCPNCKVRLVDHPDDLPSDLMDRLSARVDIGGVYVQGHDPSCPNCHGEGHIGRKVVAEVWSPDAAGMMVFREKGMLAARIHWVREAGGITKTAHVLRDIASGLVDPRHAEKDVNPLDMDTRNLGIPA